MAETRREKLAREMTHWAPVEPGLRVPDWLADLVRTWGCCSPTRRD